MPISWRHMAACSLPSMPALNTNVMFVSACTCECVCVCGCWLIVVAHPRQPERFPFAQGLQRGRACFGIAIMLATHHYCLLRPHTDGRCCCKAVRVTGATTRAPGRVCARCVRMACADKASRALRHTCMLWALLYVLRQHACHHHHRTVLRHQSLVTHRHVSRHAQTRT
jgi:hypothetical protein